MLAWFYIGDDENVEKIADILRRNAWVLRRWSWREMVRKDRRGELPCPKPKLVERIVNAVLGPAS